MNNSKRMRLIVMVKNILILIKIRAIKFSEIDPECIDVDYPRGK